MIVAVFYARAIIYIRKGPETKRRCKATMNQYELALVVNAKIEDEERAATLEAVKELITRFGGTVSNVDDWGKKRLAYEIQKMNDGFYYFIQFEADSSVPDEIEQRVRIMEKVIRYLCIRKDAK
jgi:small subunit ribosomal protein S6